MGLALIAGCGDSGSSGPSKTAYIKQANQICKRAYDRRSAMVDKTAEAMALEGGQLSVSEEQVRIVDEAVVPIEKKMVEELAALPAPEGDEEQLGALIDRYEAAIAQYETDPASAFQIPAANGPNDLVKAYGLSEEFCSI